MKSDTHMYVHINIFRHYYLSEDVQILWNIISKAS